MNLFFLRHAKACPRGPKYRPDSKRPLTREGEKAARDAAAGMKRLDLSFDLILSSPYARALRTAEILAEAYDSKKLFVTNHLAADADPREAALSFLNIQKRPLDDTESSAGPRGLRSR